MGSLLFNGKTDVLCIYYYSHYVYSYFIKKKIFLLLAYLTRGGGQTNTFTTPKKILGEASAPLHTRQVGKKQYSYIITSLTNI